MEHSIETVELALERARLIAILRLDDHTNVVEIANILCDAGIRFLEITVENPQGVRSIERVVAALGDRATIGAGTVLSSQDVKMSAEAGAQFIVSPNTNPSVIEASHARGLLALPGALTPTEVANATMTKARFIKLFPASIGGVGYLSALRGPFPHVKFVPTGGVSSENVSSWIRAGATAVAMGSNLVDKSGSPDGLLERARQAVAAVNSLES